jgi:hypothetical protein
MIISEVNPLDINSVVGLEYESARVYFIVKNMMTMIALAIVFVKSYEY